MNKLVEFGLVKEPGPFGRAGKTPSVRHNRGIFSATSGYSPLEELPVINPMQVEDFKSEAEEEVEMKLKV